jgi:pepF/M3 family oligoendopeptidase
MVVTLPTWDLSVIHPSIDSESYRLDVASLIREVEALQEMFDRLGVGEGGRAGAEVLEEVLGGLNALLDHFETLSTFVSCTVSADTRNDAARAAESVLDRPAAEVRKLLKRLAAWVGNLDLERALATGEAARSHRYFLEKAQEASRHLMAPAEEALVSDLELTGSVAWSKLYSNVSSQIEVEVAGRRLPMSAVRVLASDPDRSVRRTAYEAELEAWKRHEVPIAACLNGVKGESLLLCNRRGWKSPLEEACFHSNIDEATLEAMLTAAREAFPIFRRYLRAKARALDIPQMAFYDIFAPLPGTSRTWEWDEAYGFVAEAFDRYCSKLGDLARRSVAERWLDAEPRPGKVDGAYCAPLRKDESRILLNFKASLDSVRTLAHELGHAYHTLCLADRTALQRETPMTLAETASIFCETIVKNVVVEHGSESERLAILEGSLSGACQVVIDILSRFEFEQGVFAARGERELAPSEFCSLMAQAQEATYGDGLDPDARHPYMWAAKPHYYGANYYNFPYMFGLLFGLGIYARYQAEPGGFHAQYDELLSKTGLEDAASLAGGFGIDLRSPDFWRASFDLIRADVEAFESLV